MAAWAVALGIMAPGPAAVAACGWASRGNALLGVAEPIGVASGFLAPMPVAEVGFGGACESLGLGGDVTMAAQAVVRPSPATRYWFGSVWLRPEVRVTEGLYLRLGFGGVRREIALPDEVTESRTFLATSIGWELRRQIRRVRLSVSFAYDVAAGTEASAYQQLRIGVGWVGGFW